MDKKKLPRLIYISYFTGFFILSHVIFNITKKDDFLMFFKWSLFSRTTASTAYDLKYGDKLMLRDDLISDSNLRHKIYHNLNKRNFDWLRANNYRIKKFCHCKKIDVVNTRLNIVEYFIYNKYVKKFKVITSI